MPHNIYDNLEKMLLSENGKLRCFQTKVAADAYTVLKNHEYRTGEWANTNPRFKGTRFTVVPYHL